MSTLRRIAPNRPLPARPILLRPATLPLAAFLTTLLIGTATAQTRPGDPWYSGPRGVPLDRSPSLAGHVPIASAGPTSASNERFEDREPAPGYAGGTVSVAELRDPLKGNSLRLIQKAQGLLAEGDHEHALETLRKALHDQRAMPYALGILGVEHLKSGMVDTALAELRQATHLLPGIAANQSNLAYALGLKGSPAEGIPHARKALQLMPRSARVRYVLGRLLLQRFYLDATAPTPPASAADRQSNRADRGDIEEAVYHLRIAAPENPSAQALLTQFAGFVTAGNSGEETSPQRLPHRSATGWTMGQASAFLPELE